jgi:hypothetical protein
VPLALEEGGTTTPLALQRWYLDALQRYVKERDGAVDPVTEEVLDRWEALLVTAGDDPRRSPGRSTGPPSWSCSRATAPGTDWTGT